MSESTENETLSDEDQSLDPRVKVRRTFFIVVGSIFFSGRIRTIESRERSDQSFRTSTRRESTERI